MSLRAIHLLGSPVLRERAAEVGAVDDAVRALIADLFETMRVADGVGLAANQIGVARRVAVVSVDGKDYALVNPVVVAHAGKAKQEEGCLSIPDLFAEVTRPERVVVEAADEHGVVRRVEGEGLLGRALQHEIDHLDGILFLDHLGLMKRKVLLARWKREHKDDAGYIKEVQAAAARPE